MNQDSSQDVVATSATNLYEGVTQAEVEAYYADLKDPNDTTPISYGLNAKVIKVDGNVQEEIYHLKHKVLLQGAFTIPRSFLKKLWGV